MRLRKWRKKGTAKWRKKGTAICITAALLLGMSGCGIEVTGTTGEQGAGETGVSGEDALSDDYGRSEGDDSENGGTAENGGVADDVGTAKNGSSAEVLGGVGEGAVGSNGSGELRAQDDFYGYVNRDTLLSLDLHYGDSYGGPAADIMEETDQEVYELVKGLADSKNTYEPGSSEQLVRDAYLQYLDGGAEAGQAAEADFRKLSKEVAEAEDMESLIAIAEKFMQEQGIAVFYDVTVDRNFYKSSENAIYLEQKTSISDMFSLEDLYEGDNARENMKVFAQEVLIASGLTPEEAEGRARAYVYLALELARNTDFKITHAENPFITFQFKSEEELQELLGAMELATFQKMYGIDKNPYGGIYVQDEDQLRKQAELFQEEYLNEWKTYLLCEFVCRNQAFLGESMDFLKAYVPASYEEREVSGAAYVNDMLADYVSELYAKEYYTEEKDVQLTRMQEDILEGYHELIQEADWLSDDTRKGLLRKLDQMVFCKGGGDPREIQAEDAKLIGANAYETSRNFRVKGYQDGLARIGKPHRRGEDLMPAQIVNSMYSTDNIFCITVAIMHAPYFDVNADYAVNLGGLGMVVAHEMGHAFDSNCINYDADGNYNPDWISEEDKEELLKRMQAMEAYYSSYTVMDVYHVDGELTCGENYADKGGMECLMRIITEPEEQKKLFENYAWIWCMMKEDTIAIESLAMDEHSPEMVRVNAVLSSTDEFYQVYDVKEGDGMYVPPEERVARWR